MSCFIVKKMFYYRCSYSREITNEGVLKTIASLPALKQIRINSCRKLTPNLSDLNHHKDNVLVVPFSPIVQRSSSTDDGDRKSAAEAFGTITVSITQSSTRAKKYSLDNFLQRSPL